MPDRQERCELRLVGLVAASHFRPHALRLALLFREATGRPKSLTLSSQPSGFTMASAWQASAWPSLPPPRRRSRSSRSPTCSAPRRTRARTTRPFRTSPPASAASAGSSTPCISYSRCWRVRCRHARSWAGVASNVPDVVGRQSHPLNNSTLSVLAAATISLSKVATSRYAAS
jgi:hypothetical protein